jgi:hypothetical protein
MERQFSFYDSEVSKLSLSGPKSSTLPYVYLKLLDPSRVIFFILPLSFIFPICSHCHVCNNFFTRKMGQCKQCHIWVHCRCTHDAKADVSKMKNWYCPFCSQEKMLETCFEFNFNSPSPKMLDDINKIIQHHASRRVFVLVDNIIGGGRKSGTAVMILECDLKYLILLRYEHNIVPSIMHFLLENIEICINKLKLNPVVLITDQDNRVLKYTSDFIEPCLVSPTDEGHLIKTWMYRDPHHLYFQFDRTFARNGTILNPSIFNIKVHCFDSHYHFKHHSITERREIFRHMDAIGDQELRRKLEVVAKFFEISFQKTLLVEKPFEEIEFDVIREIQFIEVKNIYLICRTDNKKNYSSIK